MEADKLLTALSTEELLEVHDSLPAEFERRGIDIPSLAGTVAVEGAAQEPVNAEVEALDTKESITDQLSVAFSAYETVSEQLNKGRKKTDRPHVTTEESDADKPPDGNSSAPPKAEPSAPAPDPKKPTPNYVLL